MPTASKRTRQRAPSRMPRRREDAAFEKIRGYRAVLRDDFDWDWGYILRLLRYKLERTRKCIVANDIIADARTVARQIRAVEVLLQCIVDDRYYEQIARRFHKKYGRLRMIAGRAEPGTKAVPVTFKYARETPANRERVHREARRLHRQAEKMQREDLKRAFALMHQHIWGWWD